LIPANYRHTTALFQDWPFSAGLWQLEKEKPKRVIKGEEEKAEGQITHSNLPFACLRY